MAALLDRPGIWLRAGMAGVVCGLDLANALASVAAEHDRDAVRRLLIRVEAPFVMAVNKREDETDDG